MRSPYLSGTSYLDILFPSNHNIHKSSYALCFWTSDPLIDKTYKNLSIKGSEAQKKGQTNFYECCYLTKKVYLRYNIPVQMTIAYLPSTHT